MRGASGEIQKAHEADTDHLILGVKNTKSNMGRRAVSFGIRLDFDAHATRLSAIDLAAIPELADTLPLWQRIKRLLSNHEPRTAAALAEALDIEPATVRATLNKPRYRGTHWHKGDGDSWEA